MHAGTSLHVSAVLAPESRALGSPGQQAANSAAGLALALTLPWHCKQVPTPSHGSFSSLLHWARASQWHTCSHYTNMLWALEGTVWHESPLFYYCWLQHLWLPRRVSGSHTISGFAQIYLKSLKYWRRLSLLALFVFYPPLDQSATASPSAAPSLRPGWHSQLRLLYL